MDTFLPPTPPPTATARRIDFTQTTPPLPKYRHLFAAIIDNVFTEDECAELIRLAESSTVTPATPTPTWDRAMVNIGNGEQILAPQTRNCSRIILDAPDLATKLLDRLLPFFQRDDFRLDVLDKQAWRVTLQTRKSYKLTRLNERLRFLRYEGGEFFRPHWDGWYTTPDRRERSFYTIHLYLNGEGEQDPVEVRRARDGKMRSFGVGKAGSLLGGATSFVGRLEVGEGDEHQTVRVCPRVGSVLVFQQNDLLHAGEPVYRGVKYTMRTDVMYEEALEEEEKEEEGLC